MAMREFVDAECGQNPVLKVATHFTRDGIVGDLGHSSSRHFGGQELPPTTFRMSDLLKEIQGMGHQSNAPVQAPTAMSELMNHPEWAEEFLRSEERFVEDHKGWVHDYVAKDTEFDGVWENQIVPAGHVPLEPLGPVMTTHNPVGHPVGLTSNEHSSARDLLDDSKWTAEYDTGLNAHIQQLDKTELMITAEEFLKSVSDPKIKATEFMKFVEKLSTGEIGPDGRSSEAQSNQWVTEYENEVAPESSQGLRSHTEGVWADEFVAQGTSRGGRAEQDAKEEFWQRLQDQWEQMAKDDTETHPWLSEPTATKFLEPYKFAEENAFNDTEDPLEEGKKKLAAGDIPEAVLLFEAAVQRNPQDPEAWLYLGTTQALNEQDLHSIAALNKCLELDPMNLTALMSLATSLTNESFNLQACNTLKRWLKVNDRYSHLVSEEVGPNLPQTTSLLPSDELLEVQRMFIQAARLNPSDDVDADVQCGLGILFSLGADFEKAGDCFDAACGARPQDPLLWNRLGATLANGGKSSEAISAYRRALELSPGYIRTRYNLGIACVNLGAYREASDHFLTALNMQARAKDTSSSASSLQPSNMSDSIWASLRTSLHLADLSHLSPLINGRDLAGLNQQLGYTTT